MCERLGIYFNSPVHPAKPLRAFRDRAKDNPDGLGIAFYPDNFS